MRRADNPLSETAEEWTSLYSASERHGISRYWLRKFIAEGSVSAMKMAGRTLVRDADVASLSPKHRKRQSTQYEARSLKRTRRTVIAQLLVELARQEASGEPADKSNLFDGAGFIHDAALFLRMEIELRSET